MKTLSTVLVFISFSMGMAYAQKVKPTKCLFATASSGQERFEFCSEMSPGLNTVISGVCIFNDEKEVWMRGKWDPRKSKDERFSPYRICDQGVEYAEIDNSATPQGPRFLDRDIVTEATKNNLKSSLDGKESKLKNKIPAVCFASQEYTSRVSLKPLICNSDIHQVGYCELKKLNSAPLHSKKWSGNWWVQYTDVNRRLFRVCMGGVTLMDASEHDKIYEKVPNVAGMDPHDIAFCLRPVGSKLTEYRCAPSGVGSCEFTMPDFSKIIKNKTEAEIEALEKSKSWHQVTKIGKNSVPNTVVPCREVIVAKPRLVE